MSCSSLVICFPESGNRYSMQFSRDITISDLCSEIRSRISEANVGNASTYGIFVPDPDPKHSFWLDSSRMLSYYHFHDQFEVEYRCKLRFLVVRTMDGTKKTLQVDDSKTIAELMDTICSKIGITNYEEYSLIRPLDEEEKMRTLTLRKAKSLAKDQEKLEKMKQRLHTDDELNWLAPGKTLRQHGVEESDVLFLRRKYFFSDQNVDTRDPVQLNLLFVQLKEAILNGTHPISLDQAMDLAALQCQAEIGVFTPEKAKHNPIDLKEHLPKEYAKVKGVEKRIQERHKKLGDFDEREAKLRYVQLCRSLPTYGITFFLIKEKLKGKNKLVPRLFGVSKESIMRVDEKTKEILETWPLTHIRRWAAGPNLFTLDFGQYSPDGNYAMQTTEGEQIGQLISGYIDIILRRQRSRQAALNDGDEENMIVEDNVAPSRANVIANISATLPRGQRAEEANLSQTGVLRTASSRGNFTEGHLATRGEVVEQQNTGGMHVGSGRIVNRNGITNTGLNGDGHQGFQMIDLGQPKRALLSRIDFGLRTIQEAAEELEKPVYSDDEAVHGDDMATRRWRSETLEQARTGILSHLGAMTMATGQLVSCLQPPSTNQGAEDGRIEFDYTTMDASLASIGMNVQGLMQYIRLYDQVDSAEGTERAINLRVAAQTLSDAFLELMRATVPTSPKGEQDKGSSISESSGSLAEFKSGPDRVALLEAASRVGDASRQLLHLISEPAAQRVQSSETAESNGETQVTTQQITASLVDWEARDKLLSATKTVANQMAKLVKTAKMGAMAVGQEATDLNANGNLTEQEMEAVQILRGTQSSLIHSATVAGKTASRLVTCAKVVVCTMEQPESQEQLIRTAKEVGTAANSVTDSVDELIRCSEVISGSNSLAHESHLHLGDDLNDAVLAVHTGLDGLVNCLRSTSIQAHQDPVVSTLFSVSSQLPASVGDGVALVGKATALASAASKLMADLRTEGSRNQCQTGLSSADAERRAQVLQEQIEHLIAVAQECANGNAQSLPHQQNVVAAAQQLVLAAHATAAPIIRARLTQGLEFATRLTAFNVGPLVTVGGEAVRICQGNTYKLATDLEQLQKRVMPQVSLSCSEARGEPYNTKKQANLLAASQNLMQCLEDLLRSTDAVVPTLSDTGIQNALTGAARNTQACLTDLRLCYTNSEQLLSTEPPKLELESATASTNQANKLENSAEWSAACQKLNTSLETLDNELRTSGPRLLPNETLDSVCARLWEAVTKFNRSYPKTESDCHQDLIAGHSSPTGVPVLITRILNSGNKSNSKDKFESLKTTLNELVERLEPVVHGIRGLAAFFTASANAQSVDPDLARVFLVSHGVAAQRQSSISTCSSAFETVDPALLVDPSQEQPPQTTADMMRQHLLSIGQSCVADASQLISWAAEHCSFDPNAADTNQAAVIADQLTTSVNAVLGYVPGEVILRRLHALLEETAHLVQSEPSADPANPNRSVNNGQSGPALRLFNEPSSPDMYKKLASKARRLAKICWDSNARLAEKSRQSVRATDNGKAVGGDSDLIRLAHIADSLTGSLADVIRSTGGRVDRTDPVGRLLTELPAVGTPVASGLRYSMRTVGSSGLTSGTVEYDQPIPDIPLSQAIMQLRDWAVEMSLQAEAKVKDSTKSPSEKGASSIWPGSPNETETMSQMRGQCDASIRRLTTLLHQSSFSNQTDSTGQTPSSPTVRAIRVPVNTQTYAECLDSVLQINQEIKGYMDSIPPAASKRNADAFIDSVKAVAHSTCQLLQVTNQAAYLVSAAHPSSKPGRAGRLAGSDQLITLHDHIAAIRKGSGELSQCDLQATPDGLPSLEILNIANNLAQRATQLCQSTRPLLSDCKNSAEKKTLAESLERVARSAAAVFNLVKSARSAQNTDSPALFSELKHWAAQLEETVDQYSEFLLRVAGGSPSQLAEEALISQIPILDSGQTVAKHGCHVLENSQRLVTTDKEAYTKASDQFAESRHAFNASVTQLADLLQQLTPGVSICENVQTEVTNLLTDLDNAAVTITSGGATRSNNSAIGQIENSLNLVRSSLQQLEQQSAEAVDNCLGGHWELMSHNIHCAGTYLPNLVKECARSASCLSRASEQTGLLNHARTVLEAFQQLAEQLCVHVQERVQPHPGRSETEESTIPEYKEQVEQACKDLLSFVDVIAKEQGGLNWHVKSINAACAKLDDALSVSNGASVQDENAEPSCLPASFVQLHTRLGHQSRALADAAIRLTQLSAGHLVEHREQGEETSAVTSSVASLSQQFIQMTETVQAMASVLRTQTHADTGFNLAHKLCQITQAVGASCSDLIRAPLQSGQFNVFITRLNDLKAVLQSCARGADACATAAASIGRLVADLDTAALFARAGTLFESGSSSSPPSSPHSSSPLAQRQHAFQSAQEDAMKAAKGIVEDMRTLIKSSSADQDELAVSAQNCLLRATELAVAVKNVASRTAGIPLATGSTPDACIESQVQLLTSTRDVANGLVKLLNQGKAVAATCYAIEAWGDQKDENLSALLSSRQKALNETTVQVVDNMSTLSRSLRNLSSLLVLTKPPELPASPRSPTTPPSVPPKRISLLVPKSPDGSATTKANVRDGLKSTAAVLDQLEKRLQAWSVVNGSLKTPTSDEDMESEEQNALGQTTKPSQLVSAARDITQAAIKANAAAGSGKMPEIGLATDLVRRAAEELVRHLRGACHSALTAVQKSSQSDEVNTKSPGGEDESPGEEDSISPAGVEKSCSRAIAGAISTMSELKQLVEHMDASLDSGPSGPAVMQVALAMRRLRETVYEVVEGAMGMPGAKEETEEDRPKFAPPVSAKPRTVVLRDRASRNSAELRVSARNSTVLTGSKVQAEVEQSIAAANATAAEMGSSGLQNMLKDMAGEIEKNVHRICQLHSRHALKREASQRQAGLSSPKPEVASTSANGASNPSETTPEGGDNMDAVLLACQHVVHTTLSLMYWAAAAQRELVQQGRLKPVEIDQVGSSEFESQWAQGLISAARYVAAAANHLVESAQAMVAFRMSMIEQSDQDTSEMSANNPKPEALISAAQTTAACTAHLVVACVAKADPNSASCIGLRKSGAAVKRATEHLVQVVQAFSASGRSGLGTELTEAVGGASIEGLSSGVVSSMRQVIETKSNIAAKQKELERLHEQLKHIHQDQYKTHTS
ncbi:unnamed protein product [Calicophoron daubneyi]|uniref:Talin n=1 Tax=Calicophoron daubneyi TaxID=300641 RepID=A0AAV2TQS7_CALDB